jgi:ketosteroid isomerase-like protein
VDSHFALLQSQCTRTTDDPQSRVSVTRSTPWQREWVATVDEAPTVTLTTWALDSMRVKRYGSTAVVWGLITTGGKRRDGTPFSHRSRFTDVFVFRDGRWQIVAGWTALTPSASQ